MGLSGCPWMGIHYVQISKRPVYVLLIVVFPVLGTIAQWTGKALPSFVEMCGAEDDSVCCLLLTMGVLVCVLDIGAMMNNKTYTQDFLSAFSPSSTTSHNSPYDL